MAKERHNCEDKKKKGCLLPRPIPKEKKRRAKTNKKKQTLFCTLNQTNRSWVPVKKEREAGRPLSVTPKIFIHRSELREGQRRPIGVKCPVSLLPFPFFTLLSEVLFFFFFNLDPKVPRALG